VSSGSSSGHGARRPQDPGPGGSAGGGPRGEGLVSTEDEGRVSNRACASARPSRSPWTGGGRVRPRLAGPLRKPMLTRPRDAGSQSACSSSAPLDCWPPASYLALVFSNSRG
jgi:hypothetical protein